LVATVSDVKVDTSDLPPVDSPEADSGPTSNAAVYGISCAKDLDMYWTRGNLAVFIATQVTDGLNPEVALRFVDAATSRAREVIESQSF
jgi:hypothetical protein